MNPDLPAPDASKPGSPFAPTPRLGISHLLVWTACVAGYLSIWRVLSDVFSPTAELDSFRTLHGVLTAMASGTVLAVFPLAIARRRRGWPFPIHPGETLWLAQGLGDLAGLAVASGLAILWCGSAGASPPYHVASAAMMFYGLLCGIAFFWAARRTPIRRWRIYFNLTAIACVLWFCAPCLSLGGRLRNEAGGVALLVVLLIVLWRDRHDSRGLPWTHWVGVTVTLRTGAVCVLSLAWYWLIGPGDF